MKPSISTRPTDDNDAALRHRVAAALHELGARSDLPAKRGLPLFADATELCVAHVSQSGREHYLTPAAAKSWVHMREAAAADKVVLVMISGFRSFGRQLELIRGQMAGGTPIEEILSVLAPPGCSEHHTGRAVDVGTPGGKPLSESFEDTPAFEWLDQHAAGFGFRMSYPRSNPLGYQYEPWHWCHHD
jgi:D-alanyl-D-alanine carboxypeptidase